MPEALEGLTALDASAWETAQAIAVSKDRSPSIRRSVIALHRGHRGMMQPVERDKVEKAFSRGSSPSVEHACLRSPGPALHVDRGGSTRRGSSSRRLPCAGRTRSARRPWWLNYTSKCKASPDQAQEALRGDRRWAIRARPLRRTILRSCSRSAEETSNSRCRMRRPRNHSCLENLARVTTRRDGCNHKARAAVFPDFLA